MTEVYLENHPKKFLDTIKLKSGANMPMIGLGTYLCSDHEASISVEYALNLGYKHIDTAEYYANHVGINGGIIASEIPRSQVFITDKLNPGGFGQPSKTFDETIASVELHLRKLGIEYVDLFLIHHAYAGKESRIFQYKALLECQKRGLIIDVGVSNFSETHIEELKTEGLPLPSINQIEIHPLCTQTKLITYLKTNDIIPVAYSSLAPLKSWRINQESSKTTEDNSHYETIENMARKYSIAESQLLLRWALQKRYPILPKSTKPDRIKLNCELYNFEISSEDVIILDELDQNKCFAWPNGNPLDAT
jgi:2,5-diketo-D-gluconate reductase A